MSETRSLTLMRVIQPEGKTYYRCEFEQDFTLGEYKGNQALLWEFDKAAIPILEEKAKGRSLDYDFTASTKDPKWAPNMVKFADSGTVLWEKQGGKGKPKGDYESKEERAYRQESILSQKAAAETLSAISVAIQAGAVLAQYDESFSPKDLMSWVATTGLPNILSMVEQQGARMKDHIRGSIAIADPYITRSSPAPAVPTMTNLAPPAGDQTQALNKAISHFKTPGKLKDAYMQKYGRMLEPKDMPAEELEALLA